MIELAPEPLKVEPGSAKDKGRSRVSVSLESTSVPDARTPYRVPFFIPREQTYYWTRDWWEGESEADEELRRGEARIFDNTEDALRWLDTPDN